MLNSLILIFPKSLYVLRIRNNENIFVKTLKLLRRFDYKRFYYDFAL